MDHRVISKETSKDIITDETYILMNIILHHDLLLSIFRAELAILISAIEIVVSVRVNIS